jgi:hypothetical protein
MKSIKLGGLGLKFIFIELNKDQYKFLEKSNVESDKLKLSEILEYLKLDINDVNHEFGLSWGNHNILYFENEIEIWNSDFDDDPIEYGDIWIDMIPKYKNYLLIQEYKEGQFLSFEFEPYFDFDPNKITRINKEFGDFKDIITDIKYDGKLLPKTDLNNFNNTVITFKLFKNK